METDKSSQLTAYDNQGLDMSLEDGPHGASQSTDTVVTISSATKTSQATDAPATSDAQKLKVFTKGLSLPLIEPSADRLTVDGCTPVEQLPSVSHHYATATSQAVITELKQTFPAATPTDLNRLMSSQGTMANFLAEVHNNQTSRPVPPSFLASAAVGSTASAVQPVHYSPIMVHSNTFGNINAKPKYFESPDCMIVPIDAYSSITADNAVVPFSDKSSVCPLAAAAAAAASDRLTQPVEMRPRAWTFSNDRPHRAWGSIQSSEVHPAVDVTTPICHAINAFDKPLRKTCSLQSVHSGSYLGADDRTCRICWLDESAGELIQPCFCAGSSAHVHQACLQHWLNVSNAHSCEICQYQFKTVKKMKPMSQWRWRPGKSRQLAQLEATMILLAIVTPPLLCGIILCSQKIADYFEEPGHAWKMAGLMTLVFISVSTYAGAVFYFGRKFAIVCKSWINSNRTMTVTLTSNPNSTFTVTGPTTQSKQSSIRSTSTTGRTDSSSTSRGATDRSHDSTSANHVVDVGQEAQEGVASGSASANSMPRGPDMQIWTVA